MGCDVAEGVGQDSSTAVIWDFTNAKPTVVARYANNKISPDIFAFELKIGGEKFGKWLENSGVTDVGLKNTANIRAVMLNYVFGGVRENLVQTLTNIPFYESVANSTSLVPQPP